VDSRVKRRIAQLITNVLAPANLLIGLLIVVGWHSTDSLRGVAWGVGAAIGCAGIPLGFVILGVRCGWWTDIHIGIRQQRFVPMTVAIVLDLASVALIAALGGPRELVALVLATIGGLLAGLLITLWYKVSGHTAVSAAAAVVLIILYGPWLLTGLLVVAVIGWSRLALRDHTAPQAFLGLLIGAGVMLAIFAPLH
jgi:hypothetical protein